MRVVFGVDGDPAPQGSKRIWRGRLVESSRRVGPWRDAVEAAAIVAGDAAGLTGPLRPPYRVRVWFYLQRPRTSKQPHPTAPVCGDVDKLLRATGDALTTSGLIEDDRHIVWVLASKEWASAGEAGAVIEVEETT